MATEPAWIRGSEVATKQDLWELERKVEKRFLDLELAAAERSRKRWERAAWIISGAYLLIAWTFVVYAFARA